MMSPFGLFFILLPLLPSLEGHERNTLDDYVNTCLDGKHHKLKPGPEGTLFKQCAPWKKRSCCRENSTRKMHTEDWYNFSWHHCARLSPQCQSYFIQDLCFYECTPNGGPWIVQDNQMKIRNERYFNLPLCSDECNNWWNSCQDDSTCIENWTRGFDWSTGTNTCPKNSSCKKFKEIFKSSTEFCEKVWDHSWKVVPKEEPCFKVWFNEDEENPNDVVTLQRAMKIVSGSSDIKFRSLKFIIAFQAVYISIK